MTDNRGFQDESDTRYQKTPPGWGLLITGLPEPHRKRQVYLKQLYVRSGGVRRAEVKVIGSCPCALLLKAQMELNASLTVIVCCVKSCSVNKSGSDVTGVRTGGRAEGARPPPPLGKKGVQHPIWPPPLFMVHLSLPCPQYINLSAAIP